MVRKVVVGATAMMLLASAYAYAQQPPGGRDGGRRWQPRAEDRAAFLDARLAALHAGLKLTPDQENSWPAFEQAYRELAAQRGERVTNEGRGDRDRDQAGDPIQRAQRQADALTKSGAVLKRYADAAAPLYQSLDDSQKQRFEVLSRAGRPHRFAFWHNGERGEYRGDFRGQRGQYRGEFQGQRGEFRGDFRGQR
jgi:zinc resistance-associated protein